MAQAAEQRVVLPQRGAAQRGRLRLPARRVRQIGGHQHRLRAGRCADIVLRHAGQGLQALAQQFGAPQQRGQPRLVAQQHGLHAAAARPVGLVLQQLEGAVGRGQRGLGLAAQRMQQRAAQLGLRQQAARLAEPADVLFHRAQQRFRLVGPAGPGGQLRLHGDGDDAQRRVAFAGVAQRAFGIALQCRHHAGQAEVAGHRRGAIPADRAAQAFDHFQLLLVARRNFVQRPVVQRQPDARVQRAGQRVVAQRLCQQGRHHRLAEAVAPGRAERDGLVGLRQLL